MSTGNMQTNLVIIGRAVLEIWTQTDNKTHTQIDMLITIWHPGTE